MPGPAGTSSGDAVAIWLPDRKTQTMSMSVPYRLIDKAVRRFEAQAAERAQRAPLVKAPPRVITISRDLGSGGRRVADALSERLGYPVWDREVLDELAVQA